MPLQPNGRAPYTSASAAVIAIDAFRDRGLGVPVDADVLVRAGVSESIAKRTVNSLSELELLDDGGHPTKTFEAFKVMRSDEEYREALQEWLRSVYADVLQYCDPSTDDASRVQDAFRGYQPEGQRAAMASLLIGLWEYAGLPLPAERTSPPSVSRTSRSSTPKRRPSKPSAPSTPSNANREGADGMLFGVTDSDIAVLTESEFDEVWAALGKVARARARGSAKVSDPNGSQVSEEDGP